MSSSQEATFLKESATKAFEPRHREIINYNIDKYDDAVSRGLPLFHHLENSKRKAHIIKWRVMENLDKLLPEFEANFLRKGGKVIWANDAAEARKEIGKTLTGAGAKTVVKSKSMMTEEIELNSFLAEKDMKATQTDTGWYIVQPITQKPYDTVTS